MADLLNMNLTGDTQASVASVNAAMSKLQVDAATRDYIVTPRLEYRTVSGVSGPLVILDKVRRRATKTKQDIAKKKKKKKKKKKWKERDCAV